MPVADMVIKNADVITVDPAQPRTNMIAVKDGRIVLVGNNERLDDVIGAATRVIDCRGRTVVPGFNDSHCHIFSFIRKLLSVDLSPLKVKSVKDIKLAIRERVENTPPGEWITGTDYNEFYLDEKRPPTRWELDEVAPDNPVVISHRSLHACVLNSKALSLAGITNETQEPAGGRIERDITSGEPNGVLYEMLGYIREKVMPSYTEDELLKGIRLANNHYLSYGITSLQDGTFVNDYKRWQHYRRFMKENLLRCRVYMMVGTDTVKEFLEAGFGFRHGDDRLRLGGVKIIPSSVGGVLHPPQSELSRMVLEAHKNGFQVAIHAVTETTVNGAITAYENAQNSYPRVDCRHQLVHCAVCPPYLQDRVVQLKTVITTQPPFLYYSGERYLATVPENELPYLYLIKSHLDKGLIVAGGSDSPVTDDNPLTGIHAAVNRQSETGQDLLPDERISVEQALELYTINAAYASFDEKVKGSISPGKLADMVVLSENPLHVPGERIKDIGVEITIIGGEVVWEA